jgi:23S rRNA (uracil1939-C5)-methyltransferase
MMDAVLVESLDQEGKGVARNADGKVMFIEGALAGERVSYTTYRRKPAFEQAKVRSIEKTSGQRVAPRCPHFGVCGGCSLQHLDFLAQVAVKQRVLEDSLLHLGNARPETMLRPVYGSPWGYRRRARLSVRRVEKKGGVLVGFHEKRSSFIADMHSCRTLAPKISGLIDPLREMIAALTISDRLPQIEVSCGESVDALTLRIMEPLATADEAILKAFADAHRVQFWLQPGSPATSTRPYYPLDAPELDYTLPEYGIRMPFVPNDFTQVNFEVNRLMVRRAMQLLDPKPGERIADLFCGLGNFGLPIARMGARVLGLEGSGYLVGRARVNAELNGLANIEFRPVDLLKPDKGLFDELGVFDKLLIDPPREGAMALVKSLSEPKAHRIVYVSCNPATLARDAAVLVHVQGYRLKAAGVINMFPHTAHVESVALFEPQ